MKTKWMHAVVVSLLLVGWVGITEAVSYDWTGAAGDGLWSTPGNWTPAGPPVPPTAPPSAGQNHNINVGYTASSPEILIDASTTAVCGHLSYRDSDFHGPNWGQTLTIDGGSFIHDGFVMAAVASNPNFRSVINVRNGGAFNAINLCLGDTWWYTAPYVTMNIYDTSTVYVGDFIWLGGYLNLYGGTVTVEGGFNIASNAAAIEEFGTGLTRLDIHKGTLILPGDFTTVMNDWIAAGYVTAYGTVPGERAAGSILIDTTTTPGKTIITALPSLAARNPDPQPLNPTGVIGDLISDTEVRVTLNWDAGIDPNELTGNPYNPDILVHYLFLSDGVDSTPRLYATVAHPDPAEAAVSYGPLTLSENTEYYWTVEEGLDDGTGTPYVAGDPNNILGPIWSFRTKAATPEILANPANAIADPDASFTVEADDVATAYQWYKVGSPDVALSDVGPYSGTKTPTLTVTGATLAEEGQYYCRAINGPNYADSAPAYLWTARLMGHWKLDGSLLDSVAAEVPGAPAHHGTIAGDGPGDPNYVTGAGLDGGDVMDFFGDGDYVEIDDPDFFNFYPLGFTASFWYKEKSYVGWRLPLSKLDAGASGWLVGVDSGYPRPQAVAFFESENDPAFWADGNDQINVGDGQWHMITVTYDPAETNLTIYTDGDENENVTVDITDLETHPLPAAALSIGGRDTESSVDGFIDDVRIYSKVLSPLEVAQLYVAFEPTKWVCVEDLADPINSFDIDGDCRVSLSDLAEIAANWLKCQRYPATSCTD
jgi:hypothetical protein